MNEAMTAVDSALTVGLNKAEASALNKGLSLLLKPCTGHDFTGFVATKK